MKDYTFQEFKSVDGAAAASLYGVFSECEEDSANWTITESDEPQCKWEATCKDGAKLYYALPTHAINMREAEAPGVATWWWIGDLEGYLSL